MALDLETLLKDIRNGDMVNLEAMLDNMRSEGIVKQIGPGNYDELLYAAVDSGDINAVRLVLKRSNLLSPYLLSPYDGYIKALKDGPIKKEFEDFAKALNRSNVQTSDTNILRKSLEYAEEHNYTDLINKLKTRLGIELDLHNEKIGELPEGSVENRWFTDEKAWFVDGYGRMVYNLYGQKNGLKIMDELKVKGIQASYSACIINDKENLDNPVDIASDDLERLKRNGYEVHTGDVNDYQIIVDEKYVKSLDKLLKAKRKEQEELEDVIAITTPDDEKEEDLEKDEALTKADAIPASKTEDGITPGIPPKVTPAFARRTVNVEETRVEPQPKTELETKTQEQGENKMAITKQDLLNQIEYYEKNKDMKKIYMDMINDNPEMIDALINAKDPVYADGDRSLLSTNEIVDFLKHQTSTYLSNKEEFSQKVIELLADEERMEDVAIENRREKARGYVLSEAYDEFVKTPEKTVEDDKVKTEDGTDASTRPVQREEAVVQNIPPKNRTMFRDLNNLDAHMSRSEVLARLEDVELPKDDKGQKALLDEIKRQYASDKPVKGLNGRINSTDMLSFAQHIDNIIDDGEPDNIDYTQGRDVMIRSLATLDRHLQISEVLARLEDVASKTQDPNEQALLELVRKGYESKRLHPENDLSGLDSFVDSTAAVNLAERIDLAIDDGEIENVKCHINDVIAVEEPKAQEKDVVQPKKTKLGMNKSQWIKIDRDTIPPTPSKTDDDLPPAEGEEHPEEYQEEETFDPPAEEEEMNPPEGGKRVNVNVRLPKRMDPTPGIKGNWEFGPNWFSHMRVAKDSFKHLRPCYFNPKDLSPEERKLALRMLEKRGIKPVIQLAERDMGKSRNPIHKHDEVWVVGAEYDESGREIPHKERADQIKKLRNFWDACVRDESKKMAYGLDLQQPESGLDDDLPEVAGKGGKPAKKNKRDWDEGARGEAVKFIKEQGKDIGLAAVDALDKFGAAFTAASGDPEMLGCEMLCAMLVLPWDFIASYVKNKAEKVDLSIPPKGKQKDSFTNTNTDDKLRQAKALREFMLKMMQKNPKLFGEMGRKGILPDTQKGEYGENLKAIKEAFAKDPALFGRLKACFGQTAAENPELFLNCIPADYKGPVTPDALLNHIMGWGKDGVPSQEQAKTVVQPQEPVQPVVQPQTQPNSEMAQMMAVMQEMNAKLSSMQAEIQQLRAENAALRADNEQLRAQVQALQVGKTQPGNVAQPVQPTPQVEQPKMEERDIPDLTKLGTLNNLNPTMAKNIMDEDVPGFKEAASMTPEELAANPKAKFFNIVRQAYSTGDMSMVKDLVQTDQQAQWAEKLAHAVDNNNGNNVPRIKKNIALTGTEKPMEQKTEAEKKDPRQLAEEALKNPPKTPEEGNDVVQQIVIQINGKVSEDTLKKIKESAQKLAEQKEQYSKKKKDLTEEQAAFVQRHPGLQGITLNQDDKFVYLDNGEEVSKDALKRIVGTDKANQTIAKYTAVQAETSIYAKEGNLKKLFKKASTLDDDVMLKYGLTPRIETTSSKNSEKTATKTAGKNSKGVDLSGLAKQSRGG